MNLYLIEMDVLFILYVHKEMWSLARGGEGGGTFGRQKGSRTSDLPCLYYG